MCQMRRVFFEELRYSKHISPFCVHRANISIPYLDSVSYSTSVLHDKEKQQYAYKESFRKVIWTATYPTSSEYYSVCSALILSRMFKYFFFTVPGASPRFLFFEQQKGNMMTVYWQVSSLNFQLQCQHCHYLTCERQYSE